jgi:ribosomal protein S18 acetylase RimI-like enzyme
MLRVAIRNAGEKDIDSLFNLVLENLEYHRQKFKLPLKSLKKLKSIELKDLKQDIKDKNTMILLCESNSKLIGYIHLSIEGKSKYLNINKRGTIEDLYISKEYRKQGLGKRLVKEAINLFNKKNVNIIEVFVNADNKKALEFYKKFKFNDNLIKLSKKL